MDKTNSEQDLEALLWAIRDACLSQNQQTPKVIDFVLKEILPADHHSYFWGDRMLTIDKSAGFMEDPRFSELFHKIHGAHKYDQYGGHQTISWRLHVLTWAMEHAKRKEKGDFVELGVFQGDMSFFIWNYCDLENSDRQYYLYDSFEGIDPEKVAEGEYKRLGDYLSFANNIYSRDGLFETVRKRFEKYSNIHLVKGFLPGAFEQAIPEAISFLHIDLNSAQAEIESLEILFPRIINGGVIVLDDYGWLVFDKQKTFHDNFFHARGVKVLELPTGQGLAIK